MADCNSSGDHALIICAFMFLFSARCLSLSKVVVEGTVVYKWVGKNADTGRPDPSILPDIASVKRALASEKARL